MDIRTQIWYFLADSKTNEFYSSLLVNRYQKFDLAANIFLVITTSASVAAWTIWQVVPWLWAGLIGITQIVTLVKPYFLFPKYIKVFSEKNFQWQQNSLEVEELWHDMNSGEEMHYDPAKRFFDLRKKCLKFDNVPDDIIFFDFRPLKNKAEKLCNTYLEKLSAS